MEEMRILSPTGVCGSGFLDTSFETGLGQHPDFIPDVARRFSAEGSTPVGTRPEQFSTHIRSEIAKWRRLVKDAGLALH